jgi:hypothetical protein
MEHNPIGSDGSELRMLKMLPIQISVMVSGFGTVLLVGVSYISQMD